MLPTSLIWSSQLSFEARLQVLLASDLSQLKKHVVLRGKLCPWLLADAADSVSSSHILIVLELMPLGEFEASTKM